MVKLKVNDLVFLFCLLFILVFLSGIFWAFQKHNQVQKLGVYKEGQGRLHSSTGGKNSSETLENEDSKSTEIERDSDLIVRLQSYRPCHSFGGMSWLHDMASGSCYEVGTQGPCGDSMTFYPHPDKEFKTFGFCDCDDLIGWQYSDDTMECESVERPLIYYPSLNRCFAVFHKGPCEEGEWLVLTSSYEPICEKNSCPYNKDDDEFNLQFWFSHEGKCFETLTRGYCSKGFVLSVTKNKWKPQCIRYTHNSCPLSNSVRIPTLKCRPGNRLDFLGKCNWPSKKSKIPSSPSSMDVQ